MHIHAGLLDFLKFVSYFIITAFFLRILAGLNKDNDFGAALSFVA